MLIDFDRIDAIRTEGFKGGVGFVSRRMFTDGVNNIIRLQLESGASVGLHTHQGDCEMLLVLSGHGHVRYDGEEFEIHAGQAHYCPQGHTHTVMNTGAEVMEIFAVIPRQP
nr:cupin 2 conserved barrel domain protein [uncultured bacterium]